MNKIDKLLLATPASGVTWLRNHKGVGPAMLRAAVAAGLVTSRYERPVGPHRPQDHRVELTTAGKARRKELLAEQDRAAAKIAAEHVAAVGPCGLCGAVAKQGPYGWRCSDDTCPAAATTSSISEDLWKAISQTTQELEARVQWLQQHGPDCTCRECRVP